MEATIAPHPATLEHRAQAVPYDVATDPRAGYALGVLMLNGQLSDPDSTAPEAENIDRLAAGVRFAASAAAAWGLNSPQSCLASMHGKTARAPENAERDILKETLRHRFFNMQVVAARTAPRALMVLRDTAVDGVMPQPLELPILRAALAAIVGMR